MRFRLRSGHCSWSSQGIWGLFSHSCPKPHGEPLCWHHQHRHLLTPPEGRARGRGPHSLDVPPAEVSGGVARPGVVPVCLCWCWDHSPAPVTWPCLRGYGWVTVGWLLP